MSNTFAQADFRAVYDGAGGGWRSERALQGNGWNGASTTHTAGPEFVAGRGHSARPSHRPLPETTTLGAETIIQVGADRATGIEIAQRSDARTIRAEREVVLCAGTVNSPQLLMLSGIGPGDELKRHGIEVIHELPGVGRNLQDHVDCVIAYACTQPITLHPNLRADKLIGSVIVGMLFGRGIAPTFPYEAGAFLNTRPILLALDIQVHFMPALENAANLHFPKPFGKPPLEETHGFSLRVGPINPESRGWNGLRSADPADAPLIQPNYLQVEADCRTTIAGIRMVRDVIGQPAFAAYRGRELAPGATVKSDAERTAWLRANAMTTFHPVGTSRMGADPMAVVDPKLAVHGMTGLMVADSSVMPAVVSGNTNAPTVMIGEKAAEFILAVAEAPTRETEK